ncbi:Transcriptional regulators [Streptomyces sp. MnatMP-M77]|uniref:GntR family transcriptional regulator n=1 Tax=unclassified Streptomyces TaxID=2593676 RepID=UPI000805CA47|nr:GntR family transcriptional regulator [Streptomyces sp. MnatMP-M77]SBU96443.1 Transcriptional regulators [Streptomyces sp. MnatMP-M77]
MSRPAPIPSLAVFESGTLRRRVYDGLESLLADTDTYPPGTKLPTYRALCRQYGVAQAVVGAAMEALASQGRVWIRPPLGVFVLGEGYEPAPNKFVLIATTVRERIADGTFKPGTPLVPLLVKEFEVHRCTVTTALRPLADEGLLVKTGSGTYVSPRLAREPDHHRGHPPDPGPAQASPTSSDAMPVVSAHLIGTSSKLHAARAAYRGVVDMLADTTTYPPGSRLPAHSVLTVRFGVTSSALRAAMHALEADGRVRRRHSVVMVLGKNSAPAPAPTPAQLTEIVRERVQDGTIKPGEPITVRLLEEFGVGKTQLRRALAPLIAEELLVTRNGIGSYVPHPPTSDTAPTHQDKAGTPRRTTDSVRPQPRGAGQ